MSMSLIYFYNFLMYLTLVTTKCEDKNEKLHMVKQFYQYTTRNINLGNDYRILIKSRNIRKSNSKEQNDCKNNYAKRK